MLEMTAGSLENLAENVKKCANDFREDATNGGKSLQIYIATNSVDSVLNALLYRLKKHRDKIDALIELKNEEAGE